MSIEVRQEIASDYSLTERVILKAFANVEISNKIEHEMVRRLRRYVAFVIELSLVAEDEEL
jgi:predicted N-acetyltransferase YhbS